MIDNLPASKGELEDFFDAAAATAVALGGVVFFPPLVIVCDGNGNAPGADALLVGFKGGFP
jgi:hypothetical protein